MDEELETTVERYREDENSGDVILLQDEETYEDKLYYWVQMSHNDTMNSNSNDIQCQSSSNDLLQEIASVSNDETEMESQDQEIVCEQELEQDQDQEIAQTSDNSYLCRVCKKAYKSKYYVKYHEKKVHGGLVLGTEEPPPNGTVSGESNSGLGLVAADVEIGGSSIGINQEVVTISDSDSEEDQKGTPQFSTLEFDGTEAAHFLQDQQQNYIIVMNSDQIADFPENYFLQVPDDASNFILPDQNHHHDPDQDNLTVAPVRNSNIYVCDESECKMPFPHEKLLRNHKLMVHKKRSFTECKFCKEGFLTKRDMKIHIEQSHANGTNKFRVCGVCNSKFDLAADYYQHFFSHPNNNLCYICGSNFNYNTSLLLHQKEHRKHEKPRAQIICQICGMSYFLESSYKKHYDICCKILEEKNKRQE
jgi:hypothetical protein